MTPYLSDNLSELRDSATMLQYILASTISPHLIQECLSWHMLDSITEGLHLLLSIGHVSSY